MEGFNESDKPDRITESEIYRIFGGPIEDELGFKPLSEWNGEDDEWDEEDYDGDEEYFPVTEGDGTFIPREFLIQTLSSEDNGGDPAFHALFDDPPVPKENSGEPCTPESKEERMRETVLNNIRKNWAIEVFFEENLKRIINDHRSRSVGTSMALRLREELKDYTDALVAGLIDNLYLTLIKNSWFDSGSCQTGFTLFWSETGNVKLELPSTLALTENPDFIYLMIGDMLLELADLDKKMRG